MLDEKKLRRALGDLIGSAVGVSRAGPITLELEWQPEGRRDRLAVVVGDRVPGLDPAEVSSLLREAGLRPLRRVAIDYMTGARSASALRGQLAFVCDAA